MNKPLTGVTSANSVPANGSTTRTTGMTALYLERYLNYA